MSLLFDKTQKPVLNYEPIDNPKKLEAGTPVMYRDILPTEVISAPRNIMGVTVVLLRHVKHYVPANSDDIQIMEKKRLPTFEEWQNYDYLIEKERRAFNKKN